MIQTIIFDFGGVIATLDGDEAKKRFSDLGVADVDRVLDPYRQQGFFGDLEEGKIGEEEFRRKLGEMCGRELTFDEVRHCWLGYMKELPFYKLDALKKLRRNGFRVVMLSNTNPYVMDWAESPEFSGDGHSVDYYFDSMYRSYKMGCMKPDEMFFRRVLAQEHILPEETLFVDDGPRNCAAASELGINTYCPANGADWTDEIYKFLTAGLR